MSSLPMTSWPSGRRSQVAERADVSEFVLLREMGCTREEFIRWLPGATRNERLRIDADRAAVRTGEGITEISFVQGAPRTIGLISIPILNVTFRFLKVGIEARREFLAYFDLYTKRGGG